jgi:hypothetical protein
VITQEYRNNRARFPHAERPISGLVGCLQRRWRTHPGKTVEQLEQQLAADGRNSEHVVMKWIAGADDDSVLGAGEWM